MSGTGGLGRLISFFRIVVLITMSSNIKEKKIMKARPSRKRADFVTSFSGGNLYPFTYIHVS